MLIDQSDAVSLKVGEEVTLLRWGNVTINSIEKDASGSLIVSIHVTYDSTATNFSKTKKLTWLARVVRAYLVIL